jgi:hypothetical protein
MTTSPASSGSLPLVDARSLSRRPPSRGPRHDPEEVDERGDAVFRFALQPAEASGDLTEVFRALVHELVGLVVLYSHGKPVIVDAFAFANDPGRVIGLLPDRAADDRADPS